MEGGEIGGGRGRGAEHQDILGRNPVLHQFQHPGDELGGLAGGEIPPHQQGFGNVGEFHGLGHDASLQGNINTIHLRKIQSKEASDLYIAKGANIHRYYIDNELFYGLDNSITRPLVTNNKCAGAVIATQNITGTTDRFRIHATMVECKKTKFVFLHSVNILYLPNPRTARLVLACLNSRLLDWLFRKTSTNNHCNMYEPN